MQNENEPNFYEKGIDNSVWLAEEQMRMASERTYLAWVRTGLTSVGLGVAAAKFLVFRNMLNQTTGRWAGILLIIWGISIFVFALLSYKKNYSKLRIFRITKHALFPIALITVALVIIALILLALILE